MTTLYIKKGRRYEPWGGLEDYHRYSVEIMKVGEFRLVHCESPSCKRTITNVKPDDAAFLAAALKARKAMEEHILEKAKSMPSTNGKPYTIGQQSLIKEFREAMALTGAFVPNYWTNASPAEIAQAGIDAVMKAMEKS